MLSKLVKLADALDLTNNREAANIIDHIIVLAEDWEDMPTKVDIEPMPKLPPIEKELLQETIGSGMDIAGQLRVILSRAPDPYKWNKAIKNKVKSLVSALHPYLK